MPHSDLMPIGLFARRSGLTASALRFYADSGLLRPSETDPVTGYRYYGTAQLTRAITLRRLREMEMPLPTVETVLDSGAEEASRLIDAHVAKAAGDAMAVRHRAGVLKASLAGAPGLPIAVLKGPVLADAVEQILTATTRDPGMPVLGGLRIETGPEAVTLTATDRYRLSTRTLVPAKTPTQAETPTQTWAATVRGDELRAAAAEIRRSPSVRIEATPFGVLLRAPDREDQFCGLLAEEFPDYRLMLASLGDVTTRVTVAKGLLLRALEDHSAERIALDVADHRLWVLPAQDEACEVSLASAVTGRSLRVWFDLTTLYPAVSTAIGPDVMIDLRGPQRPATIRSADRGDLTTLAMPVKPDHPAGTPHDKDRLHAPCSHQR
ncbi:DNA polymerase III subunit beta family protein [Streptomyces halstedii]|uniref:DNA polymerase III subunit beta family protein n=1 Tax=Streptomyces halstedii TaxID=1944 RepID=UPI003676D2E8